MPGIYHTLARMMLHAYPFRHGQGRIVDRTVLSRLRFDQRTLTVRCTDGFDLTVFPNDHIGRHLYLTGQFDRAIVDVLRSFCRGGDRVLDIGANIGYVSCALLHAVPDCRVVSVEPQPACYELLARNLAQVGGDRGKAIQAAISESNGVGLMIRVEGNTGASHLIQEQPGNTNSSVLRVNLLTGTQLLQVSGLNGVDLIKIDVEGHEEAVLRTLIPVITEQRPRAIVFEHDGDLGDASVPIRRVFDGRGYQIVGLRKSLRRWCLDPLEVLVAQRRRAHDYVAICSK